MFTGIVEALGRVEWLEPMADAARLRIIGPQVCKGGRHGDSIAVNGVCLTASEIDEQGFTADVMAETLNRTTLGRLRIGDQVNLERPVLADGRLGGHMVAGHVDAVGTVVGREPAAHWEVVRISIPPDLARYVVTKGSVAVDGVSLTVVDVVDGSGDTWFSVSLIPTTLAETTLGTRAVGDPVNIEVDMVGKYIERLLGWHGSQGAGL